MNYINRALHERYRRKKEASQSFGQMIEKPLHLDLRDALR